MKFEDYDKLTIRFNGEEDKEMNLLFGSKSNWTILFEGEKYYCGDSDYFSTREITLEELYDAITDINKVYKNAKKDAKEELQNEFKKKNLKLIEDLKRSKDLISELNVECSELKKEKETLTKAIKLVQ